MNTLQVQCISCGADLETAFFYTNSKQGPYCLTCFQKLVPIYQDSFHDGVVSDPRLVNITAGDPPPIKFQHDRCILGVDPGSSGGGYVILSLDGQVLSTGVFSHGSPHDFAEALRESYIGSIAFSWIEKVHSMPGQGVVSMFSFGENYGIIQGVLSALNIPYETKSPIEWQRLIGITPRTRKNKKTGTEQESKSQWKNRLKSKAQQLFPKIKITLQIADALLIAEAARREYLHRQGEIVNV